MEVIEFGFNEFIKLKECSFSGSKGRESILYEYGKNELLKYFNNRFGELYEEKIRNIELIHEHRDVFEGKVIVANALFMYKNSIRGFFMNRIMNAKSLEVLINNKSIFFKDKLELLRKAYSLIKLIHSKNINGKRIYVGDVHEGNFVYAPKSNKLYLVDSNDIRIEGNVTFPSKYLIQSPMIVYFSQNYSVNKYGIIESNEYTDLFSYAIMIINLMAGIDISPTSYADMLKYFAYLEDIGFNSQFVSSIVDLISGKSIVNPLDYFNDEDITKIKNANALVCKRKTGIDLYI